MKCDVCKVRASALGMWKMLRRWRWQLVLSSCLYVEALSIRVPASLLQLKSN